VSLRWYAPVCVPRRSIYRLAVLRRGWFRVFERITQVPEYYLTRVERGIFLSASGEILDKAADGRRLGSPSLVQDRQRRRACC